MNKEFKKGFIVGALLMFISVLIVLFISGRL